MPASPPAQEGEKQVFGAEEAMAEVRRLFLCVDHDLPCSPQPPERLADPATGAVDGSPRSSRAWRAAASRSPRSVDALVREAQALTDLAHQPPAA